MNTNDILIQIDAEISRLQQARALLDGTGPTERRQPGHPAGSSVPGKIKAKRILSTEAREKIAAAQRARWAKAKRVVKVPAISTSGAPTPKRPTAATSPAKKAAKRTMSAGARAKIAAAQKARWAKLRKAAKKAAPAKKAVSTKSAGAKKKALGGPAAAATPMAAGS
jgi:hypothetical protein